MEFLSDRSRTLGLESEVVSMVKNQNRNLFISMLTLQFTAFVLFMAAAHLT